MDMTPEYLPYRSPKILSYLAMAPLAGILGINILYIILGFAEIVFPQELETDTGGTVSAWLVLISQLFLLEMFLRVIAAILFLVWLYRIFKNLRPLKVFRQEHSPGWAVGVWFIPFANLFKPHQVMQEAWRETDPDFDPKLNFIPSKNQTNSLISAWWITWISSVILIRIVDAIAQQASLRIVVLIIMSESFVIGVVAFMAILIVKEITDRQMQRAEKILNSQEFSTPPPPPTFT